MPRRSSLLLALLLAAATGPAAAQNLQSTSSAVTEPLRDVPVGVVSQPLNSGEVTHQVQLDVPQGQAPVTVRTIQPDRVAGNYRIDFDALDSDHDGYLSRSEAQANPALADEFDALDTRRSGRLSREQLAGWLK
ncbi:EF-hand domain-containing protein [Xanthomonas sp. AM6]|uniref:EF-hand domain-containing protein n=1 Tax=Xanthomonas sp. AM6 TaxID=2982531 RepID=UPI0021D9DBB7|nr:EF-hand domain-containing protein [Xanthomonas sp. AM6]UYB54470.1 EF-hand domain-containing protein [Xanthomonas sp. AM6]